MGDSVVPGPQCQHNKPQDVDDGTSARVQSSVAAPLNRDGESGFAALWRRAGYVEEAFARSARQAPATIAGQLGRDFRNAIDAIIFGMVLMMGTLTVTTLSGAAIGAGLGTLAGGAGAVPGAALGADFGLTIGEGILAWLGLAIVGSFVVSNFGGMTARFRSGVNLAWGSDGDDAALNLAAGEIAGGVALFCSLMVQGIVLWITEGAGRGNGSATLMRLRDTLIFRRCPRFEPWLIENYPRLRTEYTELQWKVLAEGPRQANSTIPEWMDIRVGHRKFKLFRDADKASYKTPEQKIGPALKHLDETVKASGAGGTTRKMEGGKIIATDQKGLGASAGARYAQVDFPISALASALDQMEANLLFKPPGVYRVNMPAASNATNIGRPIRIESVKNWEIEVDTRLAQWIVRHVQYER